MTTLYELAADVRAIDDWLDELEGDVSGCEEEFDRAYLEAHGAFDAKVDAYCALIAELDARSAARRAEAARLSELARLDAAKVTRLKSTLLDVMQDIGVKRVDAPRFRVTICTNGGKLPLLMDVVPEEVEERFRQVVVSIDRAAVYDALKDGEQLLFARLGERGQHLRIK